MEEAADFSKMAGGDGDAFRAGRIHLDEWIY
jgi:hypothetical protein